MTGAQQGARDDAGLGAELAELRRQVGELAAAQDALLRRLQAGRQAVSILATGAAMLCLLLGFLLPAFDDESTASVDGEGGGDASSPVRLVQLPFIAFGSSAPGETSNGRVLDVVMGIGFTGLLVVAVGVVVALAARLGGLAAGWPRRSAQGLAVLLAIGTCVVLLLGAAGAANGGSIRWGTLVVLAVGAALAGCLLLPGTRRPSSGRIDVA